jgi:hypothetical protein
MCGVLFVLAVHISALIVSLAILLGINLFGWYPGPLTMVPWERRAPGGGWQRKIRMEMGQILYMMADRVFFE